MPSEAGPPLTPDAASTPSTGVDGVPGRSDVPRTETSEQPNPVQPPNPQPTADASTADASTADQSATGRDTSSVDSVTPRRSRLFVALVTVAVLAYASDQLTKVLALDVLGDGQSRPLVGDWVRLKLIGNPGAALSLGAGNTWVMTLIAAAVLVAIVVVSRNLGSRAWALALGLLLGSALGNLTDRFVRPPGGGQGHVVDFIDYHGLFIGNVADIWIVGAAGLIVVLALLGIGVDGRREHQGRAQAGHEHAGQEQPAHEQPRPTRDDADA